VREPWWARSTGSAGDGAGVRDKDTSRRIWSCKRHQVGTRHALNAKELGQFRSRDRNCSVFKKTSLTNILHSKLVCKRCPIFTQCKPVLTNYDKPVGQPYRMSSRHASETSAPRASVQRRMSRATLVARESRNRQDREPPCKAVQGGSPHVVPRSLSSSTGGGPPSVARLVSYQSGEVSVAPSAKAPSCQRIRAVIRMRHNMTS